MATAQISEAAPAAIALLDPSGSVERATSQFLARPSDAELVAQHRAELDRVLKGETDQASLILGTAELEVAAVVGTDGRRRALVTIQSADAEPASEENPLLVEPIDDSPAVVWLKDLEGRYVRVNRAYTERLDTDAELVCGNTDAELAPEQSIEAPRLRAGAMSVDEPLELEYTVAAFQARPAFAVLRFALRDGEGRPTAVCGVAAPVAEAHLARSECERLMRIERWSRLDAEAIREELLDEWELTWATPADNGSGDSAGFGPLALGGGLDVRAVIAAEREEALSRFAALERALDEERHNTEAEHQRVEALEGELAAVEAELEQLREQATVAEAAAEAAADAAADAPRWDAAAQRGLSAALEGVTEWRTALKKVVTTLGSDGRWTAVIAWCPDEQRGAMRCAAMWLDGEADLARFETRTWQHRQDVTGSEFGRARNRTGPTCLLELQTAEDSLLRAAAEEGIGAAVLLPIQSGKDTLAILELLTRADAPPSAELTLFLEAVALQLGAYGQLLNLAMAPRWRTRL